MVRRALKLIRRMRSVRFTDEPTEFGGTGRSEADLVEVTVEAV